MYTCATRFFTFLILATVGILSCALAPEPDPIPTRWQLDLRPGELRLVSLTRRDEEPRAYAFLTYRVVNNTGQDLPFVPAFDMANDQGAVVRSGQNVPAEITAQVLALIDNDFVQDQIGILGTLQQGPENAKDGVVIWPVTDLLTDTLTVYAAGFSGETKPVLVTDPATGEKARKTLRKVRRLQYATPGDLVLDQSKPLEIVVDDWVMR
jgi:hypothetical protein